jgi:integrase
MNEVRVLRWRDIDLQRGEMRVHGKGGKISEVPIVYAELLADLARLSLEADAKPDEYLLFAHRVGNARTKPNLRGIVSEHRDRPMQPSTMHRWFKRCCSRPAPPTSPCRASTTCTPTRRSRSRGSASSKSAGRRSDFGKSPQFAG